MFSNSSILVLGAGELGMAVLRALAARRKDDQPGDLAVLLRPESIHSADSHRISMIEELRSLDVRLVAGDLQKQSEADLASIFQPFRTVIGCTGFAAGPQAQLKIARAVLAAGIKRFVPWQFGVDYDVIG
jgi:nucleoside-diphosphate-sugar epimerase